MSNIDKLRLWWKKKSYWKKIVISYLLSLIVIYLLIVVPTILPNDDFRTLNPDKPYICGLLDSDFDCTFREYLWNRVITIPLILFILPFYGVIYEPEEYIRLFEFSLGYLTFILPTLYYLSILIVLFYSMNKSNLNPKTIKLIRLFSIIILIIIIGYVLIKWIIFFRPYLIFTYFDRMPCNYFSQKEYKYDFDNVLIEVKNEKCRFKNNKIILYFTLDIKNKNNKILEWVLFKFKINNADFIDYDTFVKDSPYLIKWINQSKEINLYVVLDKNTTNNLIITHSGIYGKKR